MDFTIFDMGILVSVFIAGGLTAMAFKRGEIKSLGDAVRFYQDSYAQAAGMFAKERALNDGLTQELAAQAKILK